MSDLERYQAALHAMQTGVAAMMPSLETEPKHLRVGVNSSMVETSALAMLMVQKGIITYDEWAKALADAMEREADLYRQRLRTRLGPNVDIA